MQNKITDVVCVHNNQFAGEESENNLNFLQDFSLNEKLE